MERYWLNSNKLAIFVEDSVALWTEHWDGRLSLQAQIRDSCYENVLSDKMAPRLSYTVFTLRSGGDVTTLKDFHLAVHRSLYSGGVSLPDEVVIRHPIWTTWARYKQDISEDKVLQFAEEILEHKAAISQLELDDRWERSYGDFEFDSTRFPNVERMCDVLRSKGIRLSLWIHPFINLDSNNAKDRNIWGYMVQTGYNKEPARVDWWNKAAYVVDFTNPAAVYWFRERLDALKKLGVYSFKFDAGEVTYLPKRFRLWRNGANINDYQRCYAEMAAEFGNAVEVRVCSRTQSLPILVRTLDRLSTWDNAGLGSVLPIALNYSLHGYYFNLPDILNQLMVCMQMSKAPWDPMWWLSDSDEALMSSDQFVINDRVIVAPALEKGMTSREVYLPAGKWRHVSGNLGGSSGNGVYVGPVRIRI
ncbi:unnamed protein product, partial [Anisakis simplex]|uniref:Uncharacterized family 31 glucosidase KIAA1161 (inferred by orthology to a human protein) n=1 Tax=Anisakis simplex TaxID=6269 RepID=A0A0M3KEW0_ANISI